jgi:FMN phosphatase YigB (HAD superfamily)
MVGDSLSDIEAGVRLGMRTVFVIDAKDSRPEMTHAALLAYATVSSLAEFVELCLGCKCEA